MFKGASSRYRYRYRHTDTDIDTGKNQKRRTEKWELFFVYYCLLFTLQHNQDWQRRGMDSLGIHLEPCCLSGPMEKKLPLLPSGKNMMPPHLSWLSSHLKVLVGATPFHALQEVCPHTAACVGTWRFHMANKCPVLWATTLGHLA